MGTGLDTVVDGAVAEVEELEIKFEKLVITLSKYIQNEMQEIFIVFHSGFVFHEISFLFIVNSPLLIQATEN